MKLNVKKSIIAGYILGLIAMVAFARISNVAIGIGVGLSVFIFSTYGLWVGSEENCSGRIGLMFFSGVTLFSLLGVHIYNIYNGGFLLIFLTWILSFAGGLFAVLIFMLGILAGVFFRDRL